VVLANSDAEFDLTTSQAVIGGDDQLSGYNSIVQESAVAGLQILNPPLSVMVG
jgi:hypothetical protein